VFSDNNDSTYNNYKSVRKLSSLNIRKKSDYKGKVCRIDCNDMYKAPLTIIDGTNSFYQNTQVYDPSNANCTKCVNYIYLCELNNCNNANLYPHGEFFVENYKLCNPCLEPIDNNNNIIHNNIKYNNDEVINNTFINNIVINDTYIFNVNKYCIEENIKPIIEVKKCLHNCIHCLHRKNCIYCAYNPTQISCKTCKTCKNNVVTCRCILNANESDFSDNDDITCNSKNDRKDCRHCMHNNECKKCLIFPYCKSCSKNRDDKDKDKCKCKYRGHDKGRDKCKCEDKDNNKCKRCNVCDDTLYFTSDFCDKDVVKIGKSLVSFSDDKFINRYGISIYVDKNQNIKF
jgi:hypothetical protein